MKRTGLQRRAAVGMKHARLCFLAYRNDAPEHELVVHRALARRIASLTGCRFEDAPAFADGSSRYVVPNDTIPDIESARRFGIRDEEDLFGGVVPFAYVATKIISHPLVSRDAAAPRGWNAEFGERVRDLVLPGRSAFSLEDARTAARWLLRDGPVRIKLASGAGGAGQSIAHDPTQLDARLAAISADEIARHGVVIERNVGTATTYSIGRLRVGKLLATYFGTQRTTRNRHGREVYGGSTITVARGDFGELERVAGDDVGIRRAIALAHGYHSAAFACFTGMFASRCNYDVVLGSDEQGRPLGGVLEQSWRIGGASGAEVAALQALCDEPSRDVVRASTVEEHGANVVVPDGAIIYYAGIDEHLGPITKYAQVHPDAHA